MLGVMGGRFILVCGVVAAAVLALGGCAAQQTPTPEPTPTPTPRPPTATAIPTPTPTSTPTPTPTPSPVERGFLPISDVEDATSIRQILLGDHVFDLEIAATWEERARGLMNRESLAEDAGMLFVFESESMLNFWMKNTLIPLDILYMDSSGIVVDIQTMLPQPGVPDSELRTYPSAAPAQYALEINAGVAEALGFAVGDHAHFTVRDTA